MVWVWNTPRGYVWIAVCICCLDFVTLRTTQLKDVNDFREIGPEGLVQFYLKLRSLLLDELWVRVLILPSPPCWPLTAWTMDHNRSLPAEVTSVRYLVTRWGQEAVRHSSAMRSIHFLPGCQPFHFCSHKFSATLIQHVIKAAQHLEISWCKTPRDGASRTLISTEWCWNTLLTINSDSGGRGLWQGVCTRAQGLQPVVCCDR